MSNAIRLDESACEKLPLSPHCISVAEPSLADLLTSHAELRAALEIAIWHVRKLGRGKQNKTILDKLRDVQRESRELNERIYKCRPALEPNIKPRRKVDGSIPFSTCCD